jgi:hypothetical protein
MNKIIAMQLLHLCTHAYIGCYSGGDIAIAVVVYTLIECVLAAPVIAAVMVLCWKRNQRFIIIKHPIIRLILQN